MKSEPTSKEHTSSQPVVVLAIRFLTVSGAGWSCSFGFHVGEGAFRTSFAPVSIASHLG